MCVPPDARPPELPIGLRPIGGSADAEDVILTSADGSRFRTHLAMAAQADDGVVIAPDVRGLFTFYDELAGRFAAAGVQAIAFDYFGRTAGAERRSDDFAFREHVARTTPEQIQADVAAAITELRTRTKIRRTYVLGFCMGGRVAFNAAADQPGIAGVIGFYGVPQRRDAQDRAAPIDRVGQMRVPVLGLFGGADPVIPAAAIADFDAALTRAGLAHELVTYPGAPHSFFDRSFDEWREACDDAWRRVLGFIATGEPRTEGLGAQG